MFIVIFFIVIFFISPLDNNKSIRPSLRSPLAEGKINIRAVFPSHVKLSFHLYFDSVPDIQKDSTIPASHKIEDFHSAANWKEVYESGRDCQWRDLQSRRHGNSFDLYNRYTYVSKSGKGTPYSYLLNRDAVNPSTISKEWEAKTPSSPQNQSYHPEVVGNWIATTASKNTISLKNNLPSGERSMFKIHNVVKYLMLQTLNFINGHLIISFHGR